jgi:transcriptional regulator with XRE-family HTH domain
VLQRRHVEVWAALPIGKEADNLDEREAIGEGDDDALEWGFARTDQLRLVDEVEGILQSYGISDRTLIGRSRISHHTLSDLRAGRRLLPQALLRIAAAADELRREAEDKEGERSRSLMEVRDFVARVGTGNKAADLLGVSRPYLHRMLRGQKPVTPKIAGALARQRLEIKRLSTPRAAPEPPESA